MKNTITILFAAICSGLFTVCNGQIINTVAGNHAYGQGYSGNGGPATDAELSAPALMAMDASGNIYWAEYLNSVVRELNTSGIISTVAGIYPGGYSGDGGPATAAELSGPIGITFDASGNMYIAEYNNSDVRKVNTSGVITTVVGFHAYGPGYSGDGGPATAAEINYAYGVAFDAFGNMYIGDAFNNVVRKVNTSGIISTFAGNYSYGAGYSGDGGAATAAELHTPWGVYVDAAGNLYIADNNNNVIREVNTSGIISTLAGNGVPGYQGDGGQATAAELNSPTYAALDAAGNLYITDWQNNIIREVNTSGIINTPIGFYAGGGGFSGDGGPATAAELYQPTGLVFDAIGNLYFSDSPNEVIREVNFTTTGVGENSNTNGILVYPNPAKDEIAIQLQGNEKGEFMQLFNMAGQKIIEQKINTQYSILNTESLQNGIYFLSIQMQEGSKVIKKIEIIR